MRQIRINCIDCGKLVIVSPLQPCFYCGRKYKEEEIEKLLQEGTAESVEVDKIIGQHDLLPTVLASPTTSRWRFPVYVVAVLFFLLFCMACLLLARRFF